MSECKFMCLIAASFVLAFAILACGRGGIPEKQLFYDVVAAEDRAHFEATKQANGCTQGGLDLDLEKYISLVGPLEERYRNEVLAKLGVSQEEWREI